MLEATSDICSTKSAYKMPAIEEAARNPPSNIPMQVLQILRHVWADKTIQPRVKTFVWRFLRLALGIARGIRRIIWTIDENCSRCGRPEDDKHLFFDCSFARAVWFASPIGLRADALPKKAMDCILRLPPYCSKGHLKLLQVLFSPSCGVYGKLVMTTDLIA